MAAVRSSEMAVTTCMTARRLNPGDHKRNLQLVVTSVQLNKQPSALSAGISFHFHTFNPLQRLVNIRV
jgi:hypothetical protein